MNSSLRPKARPVSSSKGGSFFSRLNFDKILDRGKKVVDIATDAYGDLQMKKALLEEQRDRVSVEDGIYVPGPDDANYTGLEGEGLTIGGMQIKPLHMVLGAVALVLIVS